MKAPTIKSAQPGIVLGGLIAGPLGVAVGAASGRLVRETQFTLTFSSGTTFVCKALNKLFEHFIAHHKVIMLHAEKAKKIDAILAANPPVLPAPEPVDVPVKSNVAVSVVKPVRTDVLIVDAKAKISN